MFEPKTVKRQHPNVDGAHIIINEVVEVEPHADLLPFYEKRETKPGSGKFVWVATPADEPTPPIEKPKKAKG